MTNHTTTHSGTCYSKTITARTARAFQRKLAAAVEEAYNTAPVTVALEQEPVAVKVTPPALYRVTKGDHKGEIVRIQYSEWSTYTHTVENLKTAGGYKVQWNSLEEVAA